MAMRNPKYGIMSPDDTKRAIIALNKHAGGREFINEAEAKLITNLMNHILPSGWNRAKSLFRGFKVPQTTDDFLDAVLSNKSMQLSQIEHYGLMQYTRALRPVKGRVVESWTFDPSVAWRFAMPQGGNASGIVRGVQTPAKTNSGKSFYGYRKQNIQDCE